MTEPERAVLISIKVKDGPSYVPSEKRKCADCQEDLWVSMNGVRMAADPNYDVQFLCVPCMGARPKPSVDMNEPARAVPGALEELEKTLSPEVMERLRELTQIPLRELGVEGWK